MIISRVVDDFGGTTGVIEEEVLVGETMGLGI